MPLQDEDVHFGKYAVFWGKHNETSYLKTSYHKYLIKESSHSVQNGIHRINLKLEVFNE